MSTTRRRLLATIAVLWIAVVGWALFVLVASPGERRVVNPPPASAQLEYEDCLDSATLSELTCRTLLAAARPADTADSYDVVGALVIILGATAVAAVAVAGAVIWTRSPNAADSTATAPTTHVTPKSPPTEATPSPSPATAAPLETPIDVPTALRELKALHDEGILSEDEYEQRRTSLIDKLG